MTENNSTPTPAFDIADWLVKERERVALSETLRPGNKTALFDALAAARITSVVVQFDGSGDSGQIEDIEVKAGDQPAELPAGEIELAYVGPDSIEPERRMLTMCNAVESLVYDFLEETHSGWENNEGAYGEFIFDFVERTITLDYNERVESSEYTQHIF